MITLREVSPLSAVKSGMFQENFKIILHYKVICECASEKSQKCKKCGPFMSKEDVKNWKTLADPISRKG